MIELATLFRVINLQVHHYHNLAKGQSFFEDHAFFAEVYEKADGFYDALIERHVGTNGDEIDLGKIIKDSAHICSMIKGEPLRATQTLLEGAISEIEKLSKSAKLSQGTVNLIVGIADELEVMIYKIKRRLK